MSFDDLYELAKRRKREEHWFVSNNDRLRSLNSNVRKALDDRDYYRESLRDSKGENMELGKKNDRLRQSNNLLQYDNDAMAKKNQGLQSDRDSLKCQNERISARLCELENEAENARDLLAKVKVRYSSKIKDAENTIGDLECRLRSTEAEIRALRGEKEDLEGQICKLRGDKMDLQDRNKCLEAKSCQSELEMRDMRKQLRVKSAAIESLSDDLKARTEDVDRLRCQNSSLQSKNCQLQAKAKEDEESIRLLSRKISSLECEKQGLEGEMANLRCRLYDAQKALKPMHCLLAEYSGQMDDMDGRLGVSTGRARSSYKSAAADDDWEEYRSSRRRRRAEPRREVRRSPSPDAAPRALPRTSGIASRMRALDDQLRGARVDPSPRSSSRTPKSKASKAESERSARSTGRKSEKVKEDDLFKELDIMQSRIGRLNLNIDRLDAKKSSGRQTPGAAESDNASDGVNGLSKWELEQLFENQGFSGYERDRLVKKALQLDQSIAYKLGGRET